MRSARWVSASALAFGVALCGISPGAAALEGDGIVVAPSSSLWSRLQARVSIGTSAPGWRLPLGASDASSLKLNSLSVMGDYYFGAPAAARAHGFRATSGLLIGARSSLSLADSAVNGLAQRGTAFERRAAFASAFATAGDAPADIGAVPYVGVGYTGISAKGGWGFSADLGLMALSPGSAVKLGRVFSGTQSLDEMLRDLRLSPVLQLGVSYSF